MKKALVVCHMGRHYRKFGHYDIKPLQELGYEVHFAANFSLDIDKVDDNSIFLHQVDFIRSPFSLKNIKAYKQIKEIIKNGNYDLIHCQSPVGGVLARLAFKNIKNKKGRIIYTAHGFHFFKGATILNWLLFYPIEKYLSKYTDTLITINKEDYNLAKKKFKKCKDIKYVPGVGIDTLKFNNRLSKKDRNSLRKSLGLDVNDFVMIYVAELSKRKNQLWLINVVNSLIEEDSSIHLLLVGNDSYNDKCSKLINKLNCTNIHLLGHRNDVPNLLQISDLSVSSSKQEGLPVHIMESFVAGLPVIALNCRGMSDLIVNGINGYIVNNEIEFCDKVRLLKHNTNYITDMMNINYKDSVKYDISVISNKVRDIFCKDLGVRKIRVLHVLSSDKYSGAENVACTIIDNLRKNYDMVYCSPNGEIKNKLLEFNIKYIPLKKLSYFKIKEVLHKYNPDIIHAHDFRASCYAALFYKKYKVISHIHGNNKIMNKPNVKSYIYKMISDKFYKIIWVSDSSLNDYYYRKKVMKNSLVLYNVIDSEAVIKKSKEWNCNNNYDLIFLGRLAYPKNPERLIEIINLLKQQKNDIKVAIVGDGVDKEIVIKMISDYKLDNNVKLYGFQSNPYPILKNSKILIMTSIYEGTPMSALEAQCMGKPIIATPVDGLKKIIKNDVNGFLSDDNKILAEKIIELLNNNDKLAKMSNESVKKYKSEFNLNNYIHKIESIYKKN